ncbi:zf-HC2 domain-containing protein [Gilvimarinus sp. DA14]|uniref:anti-sigma factor family protein n=1 Tax=Gilvimarinus sp. DA14 TaxID=2956798 RepID=UPI0020B6C5ED|nr:zf-HC2 domain-containing protein [Gilvimarinus sp. DA14]UTF61151.1 zf-HC2 domain-containing protein [Gilvimarinus sp. DA14]
MLKCRDVARRASEYIDGSEQPSFTWQMRLHLTMCGNCRRFVRHLRLTRQVTRQASTLPPAPTQMRQRVLAIIAQKPPNR